MGRGYDKTLAIYDFGGGTFDFTLLDLQDRVFRTLSTAGDMLLGGDDLDLQLAEEVARQFERKHNVDLHRDVVEWQRLLFSCERAKRTLSREERVDINIERVAYRTAGVQDVAHSITRWQAHWLWKDLIGRSLAVLDRAFADAQRSPEQVHEILLVGGTTLCPLVGALVGQYFRRRPRRDIDPLTAVAAGAAIQAQVLTAPPSADLRALPALLLDVVPLTIGIAAAGGAMEPIIPRNTPVPVQQTRRFSTARDGQLEVRIKVYQGENPVYEKNTFLGELVVDGLRPAPRGQVDVDVTFEVDTDGILHVSARDLDSGKVSRTRVKLGGEEAAT
jgi:molecular chaperone DnaK